jgi:hypothetical protein
MFSPFKNVKNLASGFSLLSRLQEQICEEMFFDGNYFVIQLGVSVVQLGAIIIRLGEV